MSVARNGCLGFDQAQFWRHYTVALLKERAKNYPQNLDIVNTNVCRIIYAPPFPSNMAGIGPINPPTCEMLTMGPFFQEGVLFDVSPICWRIVFLLFHGAGELVHFKNPPVVPYLL